METETMENTNENHLAIFIIAKIKTFFFLLLGAVLVFHNLIFEADSTWGLRGCAQREERPGERWGSM